MNKNLIYFKKIRSSGNLLTLLLVLAIYLICPQQTFALPRCQVLDKSKSRMDITLDLFGNVKKSRIDKIKAFLWIDPKMPEGAQLQASLEPQLSRFFGDFESNPLLMGMMANFLDQELIFRSTSISKRDASNYKVVGEVRSGPKKFPADFIIASHNLGELQSTFSAKVHSKNFQEILGTPGSAKGDFDLLFKSKPELTKEGCVL